MSSSKVILIGAISIVFGLYTLSLVRIGSLIGNTVTTNSYIQRANLNARTGIHRAIHRWITGNFESSLGSSASLNLVGDSSYSTSSISGYYYTCSTAPYTIAFLNSYWGHNTDDTVRLTIVSHGIYKAWGEPSTFPGHEVVRTAYAVFYNQDQGGSTYDVRYRMAFDTVNYVNETLLDALQQNKGN